MQALANTIEVQLIPMLRTVLLAMLAAGADQGLPDIGVCGNLDHRLKEQFAETQGWHFGYTACEALAESWPHSMRWADGTIKDFFVPVDYTQTEDCCLVEVPLWEGPQLERRMDLVKHMLTQLGLLEQYYNEQEAALTA